VSAEWAPVGSSTWRPDLLLFDLDGCLVDSTEAITTSIAVACRSSGVAELDASTLGWAIGPPLRETMEQLLVAADHDPARAPELMDAYRAHYGTHGFAVTRVIEGMADVLEAASTRTRCAVVTSKPAPQAVPLLEHVGLRGYFEAVYAPAQDHGAEPKTRTLTRALAALAPGADPRASVMIGDRSHDIVAGRACRTRTVGVTWGAGDREELQAAGADDIVDTPAALRSVVLPG
jgi:phosphoglycolate phosphatase